MMLAPVEATNIKGCSEGANHKLNKPISIIEVKDADKIDHWSLSCFVRAAGKPNMSFNFISILLIP